MTWESNSWEGLLTGVGREVDGEFEVQTDWVADGVAVASVHGQTDLHTARHLRNRLADAIAIGATVLVVDLSRTAFIDSTTLGVLLHTARRLHPSGGRMAVVSTNAGVVRMLELTLLDRLFPVCPTVDSALAHLAPSSDERGLARLGERLSDA